jgi:beta-lactamase class A
MMMKKFFIASLILNVVLGVVVVRQARPAVNQYRLLGTGVGIPVNKEGDAKAYIVHYAGLKTSLESEIAKLAAEGKVGIFLQDVTTGAWMGIDEQETFAPASLLKIPIMMGVMKKIERGEMTLVETIPLVEADYSSESGKLYQQPVGTTFTIERLLEEMVTASDNTAKNALRRQLSDTELNSVFMHVGIQNPYLGSVEDVVSPRGITRLFRALYWSTYLKPELSEKALDMATDTNVEGLISYGVPVEVQVAHKYGEKDKMLSDCGVVYHPRSPYFLCVMTKDMDKLQARDFIRAISEMVYKYVDTKSG